MTSGLDILEVFVAESTRGTQAKRLRMPWNMHYGAVRPGYGVIRESKRERDAAIRRARARQPAWNPPKAPPVPLRTRA